MYSIGGGGGDVWVGRQRGGLTRLRLQGTAVSVERYTQADGLAQDSVYAVHRARDGAVWAGTLSGGASRFKDGVFTNYGTRQWARLEYRGVHSRERRRHDVVRNAEWREHVLARRLAPVCDD